MTSASSVLWEIRLSNSLGLCPKNLRGWSGHFQSHFLSTWEQAARWATEPRPRGRFSPPHVRLCSARPAAPSPPMASGLAASLPRSSSQHRGLILSSVHLSSSCAWEVGPRANDETRKLRGNGETRTQLLLLRRWYGQALGFLVSTSPIR